MSSEKYIKEQYDQFGEAYQRSREEKSPDRGYNEYLEMPCMFKAVGKIKDRKLLDIGCGAGVHIKRYLKMGAKCEGVDQSITMINLAKKTCPDVKFKVGSMTNLPYKKNSFDIVTGSLCLGYFKDLNPVFKQVSKVLKKNGLFYFSESSIFFSSSSWFENKDFRIKGIGVLRNKKTKRYTYIGNMEKERLIKWEMVPGMTLKTYEKPFRKLLQTVVKNDLELIDVINCFPTQGFKKVNPEQYKVYSKLPIFSIYVCRKK